MEYNGKLYGKIGNKYFDTGRKSEDYDFLLQLVKDLRSWAMESDENISQDLFDRTEKAINQ